MPASATGSLAATAASAPAVTPSRASAATYVSDAAGAVAHAAVDEARFQYDAVTGDTHLLVEGQRTNLQLDTSAPGIPPWRTRPDAGTSTSEILAGAPDGGAYVHLDAGVDFGGIRLDRLNEGAALLGRHVTHSAWLKGVDGSRIMLRRALAAGTNAAWIVDEQWRRFHGGAPWAYEDGLHYYAARWDGGGRPPATEFDLWGVQSEEGKFASSYIPRLADPLADDGRRAEDVLAVTPEHLDPTRGTYLVWFRPMYDATTADNEQPLLDSDGAVTMRFDGAAGAPAFECSAGAASARSASAFAAETWVFAGCTWNADEGVRLFEQPADTLQTREALTPFLSPDEPDQPVAVAPRWALVGEIRLFRRALEAAEVTAYVQATVNTYR